MPIRISATLRASLPADERSDLEQYLWDQSGGRCHLCEEAFNRASDTIDADHEVPVAEGGAASRANLRLAHRECNAAEAVLRSAARYRDLVTRDPVGADPTHEEFEALYAAMQTEQVRAGTSHGVAATPGEMGLAAVAAAQRGRGSAGMSG